MLHKATKLLKNLDLDCIFLLNPSWQYIDSNFIYFLQPEFEIFESSTLIITRKKAFLFAREMGERIKRKDIEIKKEKSIEEILKFLKRFRRIGINARFLPVRIRDKLALTGVQIVDISDELLELREIKEKSEIRKIEKASRIAEKALSKTVESIDFTKSSEIEIAAEIEYHAKRYGAYSLAFPTIVAFDENSSRVHHTTSKKRCSKNLVLIDFGVKYKHYCCDITRTFLLTRKKEIVEAYSLVLEAQEKSISKIKEGEIAENVDKLARDILERKYPGSFLHALGHMLGVDVHDGKGLAPSQKWMLKENMVLTVEPGVYFKNRFGIRIEDDVIVKKNKCKVITKFPKEIEKIIL